MGSLSMVGRSVSGGSSSGGNLRAVTAQILKKTNPSDTYAQIIREQFADYTNRFQPYEDRLLSMGMGTDDNIESESRAGITADNAAALSRSMLQRERSRYGLSQAADQAQTEARLQATTATADKVGALNKARLHAADRDNYLLAGGMGSGLNAISKLRESTG